MNTTHTRQLNVLKITTLFTKDRFQTVVGITDAWGRDVEMLMGPTTYLEVLVEAEGKTFEVQVEKHDASGRVVVPRDISALVGSEGLSAITIAVNAHLTKEAEQNLFAAIENGPDDVVRALAAGGDVNMVSGGFTPLHTAAYYGRDDVIPALLAAGARVDARNDGGETPLHLAAARGHNSWPIISRSPCYVAAIAHLLAAGADVMARDCTGATPLHRAVTGCIDIVEPLLAAGADVLARNAVGETPKDVNDRCAARFSKPNAEVSLVGELVRSVEKIA